MSATRTQPASETEVAPQKQRARSGRKTDTATGAQSSTPVAVSAEATKAPATQRTRRPPASSTTSIAAGKQRAGASVSATLRQRLAALYAQTLLATPDDQRSAPVDGAIAALLDGAVGAPLSPPKRAMLLKSLADFDAQAAVLRLTPAQVDACLPTTHAGPSDGPEEKQAGGLTVSQLDELLPTAWQDATRWLLEQEGYTVERLGAADPSTTRWRCEPTPNDGATAGDGGQHATAVIAMVVRLPVGWPLETDALQRAVTTATEHGDAGAAGVLLLTTAEATVGALVTARRLGVKLLDRSALRQRLATYSTAFQREQAQAQEATSARATAAIQAHTQLLATVETLRQPLTVLATDGLSTGKTNKPSGRAAVKKAVAQVNETLRLTQQALLAWETLLGEWSAAYGERPARDGSLLFAAAPAVYVELGERGAHLGDALAAALIRLATTAPDGEFGYGAWRQAVAEEITARCEALRWRVLALNPTSWQDFASAHDDAAAQEASRATNAAIHAATRAEKAATQLAERGLL